MSSSRPAAQAHQVGRHHGLDVGIRRSAIALPPGAGNIPSDSDLDWDVDYGHQYDLLATGIPVDTTAITTDGPVLSREETPTPTTVVQVSTSVVTVTISSLSPSHGPTTTLLTAPSSLSIITLSSPLPASITSLLTSSTTGPQISDPIYPNPRFGSTTLAAMVAVTPTANPALTNSVSGAKKSSGPSGGIVAAVVIILLLAFSGVAFFLFRRHRIQKRTARRVTWTSGLGLQPVADSSLEKGVVDVRLSPYASGGMVNGSPVDGTEGEISHAHATVPIITRKKPPLYSPSPSPTAPSQHYKNVPHSPAPSAPSSMVPAGASTVTSVELQNTTTLVRVTYIPQLPDELAITLGEKLQICIEFDDGWALCDNMRGERGMVPLECLEGGDGQFKGLPSVVDWRNSRRTSSLRSVRG